MPTTELRSTSTRTFVVWPLIVIARSLLPRARTDWRLAPVAVVGHLMYRSLGSYRTRLGGGGPGMRRLPQRIVTSGPYAISRNPTYLGHLVSFAAFVAATRSLFFAAVFGWHLRWFDDRAGMDEARLVESFGEEYEDYRSTVPRWLPWQPADLREARARLRRG